MIKITIAVVLLILYSFVLKIGLDDEKYGTRESVKWTQILGYIYVPLLAFTVIYLFQKGDLNNF